MTTEFLPYDRALKIKELGFDEPCFGSYIDGKLTSLLDSVLWGDIKGDLPSPTFSQAFRWFREKHNLISVITTTPSFATMYASKYKSHTYYQFQPFKWVDGKYLINDTYEEAELACLDKLIEIVETKQQEQ
jgi:hypothetical protein